MKNEMWTVYMHTCPNGKTYIGITSHTPQERWRTQGNGYNGQPFYNAVQKYGWDNIGHEILAEGLTKEEAEAMEIDLVKAFRSLLSENGYNSATGGGVNSGFHLSDEAKKRLREARLGSKATDETRKRMSEAQKGEKAFWHGKHLNEATKEKIRVSKTGENNPMYGKSRSDSFKKKMRQRMSGENNPMYGRCRTGEQNPMYSKRHKPETIEIYRQTRRGIGNGNSRPIYQCDSEMNIIRRWEYIGAAVESLGLARNAKNGIISCCRGRQKTAHGYKWMYVPEGDRRVEDRIERHVLGTMEK